MTYATPRVLVVLLAFAPGCLDPATPYCEETITVLDGVEADTPADLTAAQVLAIVAGEHASELEWFAPDGEGIDVEISAAAGTTPLVLALAYAGGEVRWVDSRYVDPPGPNDAVYVECLSRLEIDTTLTLDSDDGLLAELYDVVVVAEANASNELHWATVLEPLDPDAFGGTLELESLTPPDPDELDYHLELAIPLDEYTDPLPGEPRGYLGGTAVYRGHGLAPSGYVALASFAFAEFGPPEEGA